MRIWPAILAIESPVSLSRTTDAHTFADQFPLELRHGSEDVQKKLAGWIGLVRVEPLRGGSETNPEARQFLNSRDAIHERAAEPVELPDDHDVEFPAPRICYQMAPSPISSNGFLPGSDGGSIVQDGAAPLERKCY
jgi:hypothetical protein